ncbi:MAG: GNAT family N-acetyltransferase [Acidimicrobiales bacterium]|nr:GNAT family N-acetyltransferase [Acidimicrobiales bacterium]
MRPATRSPEWSDRWTADVVLSDGSTTHVRPIAPGDGEAIRAFHERQSRESIYFRYFSPRPRLSDAEIDHLTNVDGVDRMAFVAERDDQLQGVARYDRYGDRPVAEVAFFTDDQYHGRGIATLLLEYLAVYARETGIIRGFEAHVLPENRRMVRVFRQAGFQASSEFADGVIDVTLGIEPTEEAAAAIADRARASERQAVVRLLEPRSVAVVGASREPGGIGHRVLANLLRGPFRGPVYPVHPEAGSVAGVRAHPSVLEIPDEVDLAVVCVPAPEVAAVIEDCGRARVGGAIVISAGFAETGPDGADLQERVLAVARRFGVRVLGPNCLGVVNTDPDVSLQATFADVDPLPGGVGLLSQSGTLGAVILDRATRVGLGISSFVAVGNKADLSGNDLLRYWLDDDRTEVVLLYLESFGNPRRFGRNVREVARSKPVFAVRAGAVLEPDGDGWLDDATIDALLRQTGVVRVPTIAALLDVAVVAGNQPLPTGPRVAVIGNSGGSASMAADACVTAGLELAGLSQSTLGAIDDRRLHGRHGANPVDLRYDAGADDYAAVLDAVLADPTVDVALVVHAPYTLDDHDEITAAIDRSRARHPDVTVVACYYGTHVPVTPGGVPVFDFPDAAAHALGRVVRHRLWLDAERAGTVLELDDADTVEAAVRAAVVPGERAVLTPAVGRDVLAAAGVTTVPVQVLDSRGGVGEVAIDEPVAAKSEAHIPGARTRDAGVALDVTTVDELEGAVDDIVAGLGDDAFPIVVQPMVDSGTDVRVAVETHPVVGPVLRVGPGGGAGRFTDAARQVLPVTDAGARELVDGSAVAELLDDRAQDHLVELVRRLGAVVDAAPEIVELICDPVIVRADAADVVEVRIAVEEVRARATPPVRRLDQAD